MRTETLTGRFTMRAFLKSMERALELEMWWESYFTCPRHCRKLRTRRKLAILWRRRKRIQSISEVDWCFSETESSRERRTTIWTRDSTLSGRLYIWMHESNSTSVLCSRKACSQFKSSFHSTLKCKRFRATSVWRNKSLSTKISSFEASIKLIRIIGLTLLLSLQRQNTRILQNSLYFFNRYVYIQIFYSK